MPEPRLVSDRLSRNDPAGWSDQLRINLADDTSRARQALRATMNERDLAAADADRRSCQGGWRLAQERAVRVITAVAEVEPLREAARHLISVYMAGGDLADAVGALEDAAGFRQQEGS